MIKRKIATIAVLGAIVLSVLGFSGALGGSAHVFPADPPVLPIERTPH
jgi:hypothetical protein